MRNTVREYIEFNDEEKIDLWNTATFVFDTNIFLNLYRYSNKTRTQLLDSLEWLNNRIWMPYQVAYEFCKDRYDVIVEANRRFDIINDDVDKLVEKWKKELRLDNNDSDISNLVCFLQEWITKKKDSNYLIFDPSNDEVFQRLLVLFDGKVGNEFTIEEKTSIEQDGKIRYENKMPPGFKDSKKQENRYGDLFVWKELLQYAKSQNVDIIFVTHDQKEDWWNISGGKTIGPRIELRKEFFEETGRKFHMYTMSSFLSFFIENKGKSIDKTTMDEVALFASVMKKRVSRAELKEYYDSLDDQEEKIAAKLRFKIAKLERKNQKRRTSIEVLRKNARERGLSEEENVALQRNQENLIADEDRIIQLNEKLSYIMSMSNKM